MSEQLPFKTPLQYPGLSALIADTLDQRDWEADVDVTADNDTLVTDPSRLERILANLVDNALRHGSDRPAIHIDVEEHEVVITVVDHGPGIPDEHLPHIFDRFYKANRSRSSGGSGLGLAIAAENARLLGASITAGNNADGGAHFQVTLPRHP